METLIEILKHCTLCPRKCGIDRTAGEKGFCRLPGHLVVDCALPHLGEEPPLSGSHGSGTIFFSSCNLRCIFCQNYQISHEVMGKAATSKGLARTMLNLQEEGCHNINAVTPTPQVPFIIEGLHLARRQGLVIPFIYNCSGYEDPAVVRRLAGDVDIYLPDFKYGSDESAFLYSGVKDYVASAIASIKEMALQVGDELEIEEGIARKGLLIRHLLMPGMVENSIDVLKLIRSQLSQDVALSIMSQYTPITAVKGHPLLRRRISCDEYEMVVEKALDLGFENLTIQAVDERQFSPDFAQETPFPWNGIKTEK
jgi:putative pyruvate formate lyase activating enzyme